MPPLEVTLGTLLQLGGDGWQDRGRPPERKELCGSNGERGVNVSAIVFATGPAKKGLCLQSYQVELQLQGRMKSQP